jgi:hypothetical protein
MTDMLCTVTCTKIPRYCVMGVSGEDCTSSPLLWRSEHKTACECNNKPFGSLDAVLAVGPYLRIATTQEWLYAILTQNSTLHISLQSRILVFWLVTLCSRVTGFRRVAGTYKLHLLGGRSPGTFFKTTYPLKMKSVRSVDMSGISNPATRPKNPQDLNQ